MSFGYHIELNPEPVKQPDDVIVIPVLPILELTVIFFATVVALRMIEIIKRRR